VQSIGSFQVSDFLTITSIVVALIVGIGTWVISWLIFRAQTVRKRISYFMRMIPIVSHEFSGERGELEIRYNGEEIDRLVLLELDLKNTGNAAIIDPPIKISNEGGVYLIPGYFEDIPAGYAHLWSIEREDGEDSLIHLAHLNPGQVAKVRFVMDNLPSRLPELSCPMPDLHLKQSLYQDFRPFIRTLFDIVTTFTFGIRFR
jgi:hypothetical protein